MIFKPMKREDALRALKGQENIIAPAVREHEEFFKRLACPSCGSNVMAVPNHRQLFREGSILPNYLAKCTSCETEFDPYTKIIVTLPAKR